MHAELLPCHCFYVCKTFRSICFTWTFLPVVLHDLIMTFYCLLMVLHWLSSYLKSVMQQRFNTLVFPEKHHTVKKKIIKFRIYHNLNVTE